MKTTQTHWNQAAILIVAALFAALLAPLPAATGDTTPPTITVSADPASLWPPNGKMIPVTISGTITDTQSGVNAATAKFTVYDQDGTVQPSGPVTLAPDGSFSFTVMLQASRNGSDLTGRHYSITVRASDNAGNPGFGSATVVVPHDQGPVPVITSLTICIPAGTGPVSAAQGNCPTGTVDSIQSVVGSDGITSVNDSLNVGATADEHSSVFPPNGLGTNQDYLFFVATAENNHNGIGMAVLSGGAGPDNTGKWTFNYPVADASGPIAGAYGSYSPSSPSGSNFGQVFNSPNPLEHCPFVPDGKPQHQDQTFDLNYAAGGSVVRDPTAAPGSFLMVYEGTNACIDNAGGQRTSKEDAYISLSIATSLDYGKTWPTYRGFPGFTFFGLPDPNPSQPPNAPMGAFGANVCMGNDCSTTPPPAYGRYPVVTPPVPLSTLMAAVQSPNGKYGEQEISGFVDNEAGNSKPFLYANSGGMRVARAQLNGGTAPLQFYKWDGYAFETDGLWGAEMSFLPVGPFANCEAPSQNQFGSSISYVEDTRQYLLLFVCISPGDPDPAPGEPSDSSNGAAWFFSTSYDLSDPMQWTTPQKITGSWYKFPGKDPNLPPADQPCDAFNGWYPTIMSLDQDAARLTHTGYVFSMSGCQSAGPSGGPPAPHRVYSSRAFTMTIGSSR
jgi:hypothetical protein